MFDAFSGRSRIVVFGARLVAGERGSAFIDVEDLLIGLLREDQGTNEAMLSKLARDKEGVRSVSPAPTHKQFFDPTIAGALLSSIEESLPHLEPIELWVEIPLSGGLARVFEAAEVYRTQFHHDEIQPLHLLAAVFNDEESLAVRELGKTGITQEEALKHLRALG
jgi:ATP-dependent Clp protease ATP-binding subunit ClpA